ncbi:MAG: cation-translocating P-type ATPase [Spirochaetales bacterium]|nr:cation-translocating P-type ATPase [Spirochaetales bacterium]
MYSEQDIKNLKGLTRNEYQTRLKTYGYNELPATKKRTIFHLVFEVVKEPMFILLIACGSLYLFMGNIQEALMLLGFVFVIIGISIYQEGKTEKALEALRDLSSPRALVIRDGKKIRISGKEVVIDDIIVLTEGDRVPADAVLVWGENVNVDESLLTGESVAVRKKPAEVHAQMQRPGGDDIASLFSGTMLVSGHGVAVVKRTGMDTEMGKIGKALQQVAEEKTLLQKETGRLVGTIFTFAVFLCAFIIVFSGVIIGDWLKGILSGITLAMAMLPEEFPVVLAIFLALGAWRISKKKVLTRKVAAVETLGASTVLCSDKTGTITKNKMAVKTLMVKGALFTIPGNRERDLPEEYHELIEYGILASQKDPFDPMEKAFKALGQIKLSHTEHLHDDWKIVQQYPLSHDLLVMSHVWESLDGGSYIIAAKGAPEAVADLCHLNDKKKSQLEDSITRMASEGLRVIGVAKADFAKTTLPEQQHDFEFKLIGLVGLEDPVRSTVPAAVRECYIAGIRVVMITGDYPLTALNIAQQIGLKDRKHVITGPELDAMPMTELRKKVKKVNIFARVVPEQKLKIVDALKANGEVVAMTGDGVNDAPALKSAHIGIAMGERGTDVAREAASLVLLDDSFPSIVSAVKQGRQIFDNLKKAMSYIISVHIPIAGATLIPLLLKWPVELLSAVHIVFLELIIDPSCTIVFEAENPEKDIMQRKPRDSKEPLFNKKTLSVSILQGIFSLAAVLGAYLLGLFIGRMQNLDPDLRLIEAKTLAFATLIISNLCLIMVNRSWSKSIFTIIKEKNVALLYVAGGALLFLGLVIYVPFLQDLFHFSYLHFFDIIIALSLGIISILWFEVVKKIAYKRNIKL